MRNRATFYEEVSAGPEAGSSSLEEVFSSACAVEELSQKDFDVLGLSTGKRYTTIVVRNSFSAFTPDTIHKFKIRSGLMKDKVFNVKEVSSIPGTKEAYLKIIGEAQ